MDRLYPRHKSYLTVGKLRKALEGLDDEMVVVREGSDHRYMAINTAAPCRAIWDSMRRTFWEHYESEEENDPIVEVFSLV